MQISLPSASFGHVWLPMFAGMKNFRNFYIILRRGSTSGFLSSSLFLCWSKPTPPDPPTPQMPPLSDFLFPSVLYDDRSTQAGVVVIRSPLYNHLYNYPNSNSATIYTSSSGILLHEFVNICTCLWILSTISAPKIQSPVKALSY